jgi:hypothetical protein
MCDLLVDDNMLIKVKDNVDEENLIVEFKIKLPMLPFEVVHLLAVTSKKIILDKKNQHTYKCTSQGNIGRQI